MLMPSSVRDAAIRSLKSEGWRTGAYHSGASDYYRGPTEYPCGPYCIVGAVAKGLSDLVGMTYADALRKVLDVGYIPRIQDNSAVFFNDHCCGSAEDAIEALQSLECLVIEEGG